MNQPRIPRRDFLKMSAGLTGTSALAAFAPTQAAFAKKLSRLSVAAEASSFADMRSQYLLSPNVIYFNHGSMGTLP
ncbi:MAG: twin-arginine translocation signal domain-containing protein [bacterium]